MDNRKFESGASASPPSAPVSPSSGYPTNGNPGTGTPATVPGEWWFHQVGEELRAVLDAGGITPDHTALTQLRDAIYSIVGVGAIAFFAKNTAPTGWLKANGAAVSRTTYAALFAAIGTTFGAGDGSTTFNLPDLRGEFLRGWDDGRGVDPGRTFASAQKGTLVPGYDDNSISDNISLLGNRNDEDYGTDPVNLADYPNRAQVNYYTLTSLSPVAASANFYTVARPRNIALLACIKY